MIQSRRLNILYHLHLLGTYAAVLIAISRTYNENALILYIAIHWRVINTGRLLLSDEATSSDQNDTGSYEMTFKLK